jgi:hypothetical protein
MRAGLLKIFFRTLLKWIYCYNGDFMSSLDKMISSKKKMNPSNVVSSRETQSTTRKVSPQKSLLYPTDGFLTLKSMYSRRLRPSDINPKTHIGGTQVGVRDFCGLTLVRFIKTTQSFYMRVANVYTADRTLYMLNNPKAKDVSWDKLVDFVTNSSLIFRKYEHSEFVCGDFASRLHNKAEASGIRCGLGIVEMVASPDKYHAINVFGCYDNNERFVVFVDMTAKQDYMWTEDEFARTEVRRYCNASIFV